MPRKLGLLFLGIIAGGLLVHLFHAARLEKIYWDKEKLKVELFETTERLARGEALWADRPAEKVSSVELVITGELDDFEELELQRQAGEITAPLIGSVLEELEPELVVALLHRRKLTLEGKDYRLDVNWVVIAPRTRFNLSVSPAPAGSSRAKNRVGEGAASFLPPQPSACGSALTAAVSRAHGQKKGLRFP
ncbi:MAG: hypothetical protein GX881_01835 [Firmicutes bacterium]|nr:hypothetical protein [Bacillota bacterium]